MDHTYTCDSQDSTNLLCGRVWRLGYMDGVASHSSQPDFVGQGQVEAAVKDPNSNAQPSRQCLAALVHKDLQAAGVTVHTASSSRLDMPACTAEASLVASPVGHARDCRLTQGRT